MEELGFAVVLFDNFLKMGKEKITTNIVDEKRKEFERFIYIYIYGKKYSKSRTKMQTKMSWFIKINRIVIVH